jgi:ribonuclease BN (tRNA processing enzyme)
MRVILLGTQAGPTASARQLGIATLVVAGSERLLFDAGRGVTTGMVRGASFQPTSQRSSSPTFTPTM